MKRLSLLSFGLIFFLTSCLPLCDCRDSALPPTGLRPFQTQLEPSRLISESGAPLILEEEGNCPADEVRIPGEGSKVVGSIGGFAIAPNPGSPVPASAQELGRVIAELAAPRFAEPAVLLIVDDFNGNLGIQRARGLPPGVFFLDQQGGPKLSSLTSTSTEDDAASLEAAGQYSHGALVFNHTLALLRALQPEFGVEPETIVPATASFERQSILVPRPLPTFSVMVANLRDLNLRVVAVDTEDFNTEVISQRLAATIEHFAQDGTRRFAVNMSFGLVPCSVLRDFNKFKDSNRRRNPVTFEEYEKAVAAANAVQAQQAGLTAEELHAELKNILTTPVNSGGDPLQYTLGNEDFQIAYLASAGNYKLPYSLYPAYWSEFVGVSASRLGGDTTLKDPDYSNTGEVLLEGGYFTLTGYDPATGSWTDYPQISVAGTSFAAPVLSVFTALDLTSVVPRCAQHSGDITTPLAFFKTDSPIHVPIPTLDLPLETALESYCGLE